MFKGIAPPSQFPAGVKIGIGCLNLALSGAQKWAEMLHHPSILGGPQTNGDKIRIGCLNPVGGNATSTLLSQGYPTKWTKAKH